MSTDSKIQPRLKWLKLKRKVNVIIPQEVFVQIKYLCDKISSVEWSGILFYDTEGDIDSKNFKVVLKHIYPMDKGTGAATDYEFNERFVDWRMKNPHTFGWKIGHIHSHNTMGAFFSGTDNSEIEDNSEFHNYYLSIVVNNKLDIVGKIGFRGKQTHSDPFICKTSNGFWNITLEEPTEVVFEMECSFGNVNEEFAKSVQEIIEIDKKKINAIQVYQQGDFDWDKAERLNYGKFNKHNGNNKPKIIPKHEKIKLFEDWSKFLITDGDLMIEKMTVYHVLNSIDTQVSNDEARISIFIENVLKSAYPLWVRFFSKNEMTLPESMMGVYETVKIFKKQFEFIPSLMEAIKIFCEELKVK